MIVLEGVDSSGKSTIAEGFRHRWGWPVERSRGAAKNPEEINNRLEEYAAMGQRVIFDRHPAISELIYGPIAQRPNWIQPIHVARFWTTPKLLIFCRPSGEIKLASQTNLGIDTPEYVAHLTATRTQLVAAYDEFFSQLDSSVYTTYDWRNLGQIIAVAEKHVHLIDQLQPTIVG